MPTENELITAEKLRRKPIVASLGTCRDCGQPVMEGQDFRRLDNGIRHTLPARELKAAKIPEIVVGENWMRACSQSVEKNQPLNIYAYAARSADKWLFDMHVGEEAARPSFGWAVPHIYVPMSEIFKSVYSECKNIAGGTK